MVSACLALISTLLSFSDHGCLGQEQQGDGLQGEMLLPPWWSSLLGVRPLEPRTLRADKEERFWATRGKKSHQDQHFWAARGKRGVVMKPNGLFGITQGKRSSFKPNSLFSITAGKRSSFKPNNLFSLQTGKRSYLKPNGLFSSIQGKRSLSLKPNGLFSLPKRSVLNSSTMDSELSTNFEGKMG